MSRRTWVGVLLLVTIIAVPPAVAADGSSDGRYIAGPGAAAIWCSADHSVQEGVDDAVRSLEDLHPLWPLAAQPECWAADVLNDVREATGEARTEWGFGGFAWGVLPQDLGSVVRAATEDDLSAQDTFMTLYAGTESGNDVASEGCGPQTLVLPLDLELHWLSTYSDPLHIFYAFIPVVGIDEDLHVCIASTGSIARG